MSDQMSTQDPLYDTRAPTNLRTYGSAIALTAIILAITALLELIDVPRFSRSGNETMIMIIIVLGLNTFVGNSGIVSFCHVMFAAVGAYISAWLTCQPALKAILLPGLPEFLQSAQLPIWMAMVCSVVVAMLVALVVGWVILRLSGFAAAISTFALLGIFNTVFSNWDTVTAGTGSIAGIPTISSMWIYAAAVIAVLWVVFIYKNSRFGLALRASRDDEVAARAGGIKILASRVIAFGLSAGVVAFGGTLQAHNQGVITVDMFYLDLTLMSLAMLVIGGRQSLSGSVIGVGTIYLLIEVLRRLESGVFIAGYEIMLLPGMQELILGAVLITVLRFRPDGLFGNSELLSGRRRRTIRARESDTISSSAVLEG